MSVTLTAYVLTSCLGSQSFSEHIEIIHQPSVFPYSASSGCELLLTGRWHEQRGEGDATCTRSDIMPVISYLLPAACKGAAGSK